jgi:hypothetical protein
MTDLRFKIARWIAVPAAIFFAASWLLLPSRLQLSKAVETTALATRSRLKGEDYLFLQTPAFGEVRVQCIEAPKLCELPIPRKGALLRVWLQDVGLLGGRWIVAAEFDGETVASQESQAPVFRTAKVMWGLGSLIGLGIAFILWHFAPFKALDPRET